MADEPEPTEPVVETTSVTETVPPVETPTPDPIADLRAELQAEREARARLEGQLQALQKPAEAAPPKAQPAVYSHEQIEAALTKGEINDAQARVLHARTAARAAVDEQATITRQSDAVSLARDTLNAHLTEHADLRNPSSARFAKVLGEVDRLERLGYDRTDLRTQLLAVEAVVGRKETPVDAREWSRLRMPTSGVPSGGTTGPPTVGATDPLKSVPPSILAEWGRHDNLQDPATRKWYAEYWTGLSPRRRARLAGAA